MTGEGRESNRVLKRMQVPLKATLLQAMRAINSGGAAIAFAVNDRGKVLGTITDGDLRRAILNGATLQDCAVPAAMRKDFTFVSGRSGRVEVLDMMRARGISQVPILDRHGRLVGLHLLQDLIGAGPKPNWAVILAGGRGERLHPLTLHVPKPMIPVAGRPILERLVLQLVGVGIRRIFLSVNYLAEVIERHFRDGERFGCSIEYLRENRPLGTGGPLALLPTRPRHPLLVLNGDLVTQADLGQLLAFHRQGRFSMTSCVRSYQVSVPFGVATVRRDRLVALREKPTDQMLINAGIYVVNPSVLRWVRRGKDFPVTDLIQTCLDRGLRVGAHYLQGEWHDVGRPNELWNARGEL